MMENRSHSILVRVTTRLSWCWVVREPDREKLGNVACSSVSGAEDVHASNFPGGIFLSASYEMLVQRIVQQNELQNLAAINRYRSGGRKREECQGSFVP